MNRLRKRIKELVGQSPSSVAYLADVTGADEADVQRELAEILEAHFSKIVVAKDEDAVRDAIAETGAALREFYREAL